jgi:phosphatidylglycerol:prolipoprotein diacylglycerol transferase
MHPILFRLGSFPVGTYGLLLALAFFAALALAKRQARLEGLDPEAVAELSITLLLAGILGSKLLLVIVGLLTPAGSEGALSLDEVFSFSTLRAGGAIHGGVIAAALAFFLVARKYKLSLRVAGDTLAPATALGQAIGRLGCLFAGCCYGSACDLPWAITFNNPEAAGQGTPLGLGLHPVQIYTLLANLLVMTVLLLLRKRRPFRGFLLGAYFVQEGLGRMVTEIWRGDLGRGFWLGQPWLSTGRLTALGFITLGILLWVAWRRPEPEATPG